MLKSLLSIAALTAAATVVAPAAASASPAQVTANVNLRTGPGTQYYPILVLPAGVPVELYGCLQGYTWCDISYGRDRGWVSSRYLSTFYSGPIYRPQPYRSVPFLSFNFGYWDNHYRDRPWYQSRPRPGWDRGPDWGRPRPDWDRPRPGWDRPRPDWDRPRSDWDRPRPDWDRDRPRPDWDRNRDRPREDRPLPQFDCPPDKCGSSVGRGNS